MSNIKRVFLIFITSFLMGLTGIAAIFSTMFIPGSKEHNYIMYQICLPAIDEYYEKKGISRISPSNPIDKNGQYLWWYQHLECEENVRQGKGPVFSENPPGFNPKNP